MSIIAEHNMKPINMIVLRLENIGVTIPTNFASWFLKRFLKNMTKIDSDEKHLYCSWIYLNCNSQYKTKASDKIQKIDIKTR